MRAWRLAPVGAILAVLVVTGCSTERKLTEKDFVRISLDLYYEGRQAEESGDLAAARDLYTRSLRLAPRPIVYYQLGMVEFKEKHPEAAIEQMKKALALSANFTQASEMIKRIQAGQQLMSREEGQPRLAEGAPIRVPPPPPASYARPRSATPEGRIAAEPARPAPPAAVAAAPEAATPVLASASAVADDLHPGLALLDQHKFAEAETWFKERVLRDPGNADLHFYLGNAQVQQGNYNGAYQAYLRALAINPDMARAYVNLGFCQEVLGNSLEAEKSYLRAIQLANHPDALYNLGLLYQKRGLFADSVRYLEAYLAAAPTGPSVQDAQRQIRLMRRER